MGVFLFDFAAILLFWKLADRTRIKELFPIMMTAMFMRFLDHYIVIDWLKLWKIFGPGWFQFFIPVSANVTVWPISSYLFIQYLPKRNKWLYGACWSAMMLMYLQLLQWLHVFAMGPHWNMYKSAGNVGVFFLVMYGIWRWLTQQSNRNGSKQRQPKQEPREESPRIPRWKKQPLR